ncbi:nuclear pore complex protein Nup160 homolog [Harmonia axyridis]|uniref:nuclear pore complex protein Nup160 homolog n=1 Tax=Harmonia axyridis TaxID=115357 RepID=UPI001E27909B|nr:nuclear pore complex protein Nup160 homolog [Harmonia axyridis]
MTEYPLSYREVIPEQTGSEIWREITLNTGGTQSILQDIKLVDKANGFCYKDSSKHFTRNRFIYWRVSNDTVEFVEHSLDINLSNNRVRYKFVDTPVLDGISIHETGDCVIILVPTVCSIHQLRFPHPRRLHKSDELLGIHSDVSAPSIFADANEADARRPSSYFIFTPPSSVNSQLPYLASSTYSPYLEESIFVLAYPSGETIVIHQTKDLQNYISELKNESIVPRFLSGLAEKFRQRTNDGDKVVSLVLHSVGVETYAITLTRDGHLKFWSCSKVQCISVINILSETGDYSTNSQQGTQNHVLRKAVDSVDKNCLLAIFLSNQNQFHIIKPLFFDDQIRVNRIHSLYAPENDLIDMSLTMSRIWSVWRSEEGDCKVYSTCLQQGENDVRDWTPIILEELPENQPPMLDSESDPSQVYLQYIFHPGRFPLHVINKALNTYKRSTIMSDINLSPAMLKEKITFAVHNEIQKELKETEVGYEEFLQSACWCWERFYSCCEQYHAASLKPLGILLLPGVSGAVFLKKSAFSFFRPLDTLEYMLLCSDSMSEYQFLQQDGISEDVNLIPDMMTILEVIVYLNSQMSEVFGYTFEKELHNLRFPDVVMEELLDNIQSEIDNEFTSHVSHMLSKCKDLHQAMHKLLELVRDAHKVPEGDDQKCNNSLAYLFTSQLGVSMVNQSLRQQAQTRFNICRNLLLISNILLKKQDLRWEVLESIRSVCSPDIVVLTQASYVMYWLSSLPALPVLSHESITKRLAPLKLNPVFNIRNHNNHVVSVLSLFIGSSGGQEAHKRFWQLKDHDGIQHWHYSLLPYLSQLFHTIWPVSKSSLLAEWLLSSGQHVWLQEYVRLLRRWCEWNNCTRNFLLACSYLLTSENYKARELFELASKGIFTDSFLVSRILRNSSDGGSIKALVTYYLKVIQLFELNNADDYAIHIANTALTIVGPEDHLAATLYSIKFKHHLKLKHYSLAYDALNSNPDEERKRDNLRDLVKCLLDSRELNTLMNFNYGDLEELFHEILLSRARAIDVVENIFYDFLYSYHVKRGPPYFFRAGSIMYEQAFRLSYNNCIEALEKQVKCYLASLNILRLCNKEKTLVSRPKDTTEDELSLLPSQLRSTLDQSRISSKSQMELVSLDDIKREYDFACAKLKLAKYCPQVYDNFAVTNPSELLVALVSCGLYQVGLNLCKSLDLPYDLVFDHLTGQCIVLTEDENTDIHHWNWIIKNDTQDLLINNNNPADVAWLFLQQLLEEYEEPGLTVLHKVVCKKIIQMGAFIPHWLYSSYKIRNAAELLRLLHATGRLEEAIDVASKYMLAIMGHGKEYYGLKASMSPTGEVMYCPVGAINNLILELELQIENNNEDFTKDYELLKELFSKYLETSIRISNELCRYRVAVINKI